MLLLIILFLPLIEIYFLFKLSAIIGGSETFMMVLATGFLGFWLIRNQGVSALQQMQMNATQNQTPSDAIAKSFFNFAGGILLLIPGPITDVVGLSFIFPPTRYFWKKHFLSKLQSGMKNGRIHVVNFGSRSQWPRQPSSENPFSASHHLDDKVIDISAKKSETTDKEEN